MRGTFESSWTTIHLVSGKYHDYFVSLGCAQHIEPHFETCSRTPPDRARPVQEEVLLNLEPSGVGGFSEETKTERERKRAGRQQVDAQAARGLSSFASPALSSFQTTKDLARKTRITGECEITHRNSAMRGLLGSHCVNKMRISRLRFFGLFPFPPCTPTHTRPLPPQLPATPPQQHILPSQHPKSRCSKPFRVTLSSRMGCSRVASRMRRTPPPSQ